MSTILPFFWATTCPKLQAHLGHTIPSGILANWKSHTKAWENSEVRRDSELRRCYTITRRNLENANCIGDPLVVLEESYVGLCVLHCAMAMRRLPFAVDEQRLQVFPAHVANVVQVEITLEYIRAVCVHYRVGTTHNG